MIPAIASIIAIYAIARLIQVPLEGVPNASPKLVRTLHIVTAVVSLIAILLIILQWQAIYNAGGIGTERETHTTFKRIGSSADR